MPIQTQMRSAVLFLALILLTQGCQRNESGPVVRKLLVPPDKTVMLEKSPYTVWVFDKWKSKGLDSVSNSPMTKSPLDISILGPDGVVVNKEAPAKGVSETFQEANTPERHGLILGIVNIEKGGTYNVRCSRPGKAVVVLVPPNAVTSDLSSNWRYVGDNDDSNFVN